MKKDRVDAIREQWARERPDLDTWPVEIVARVGRTARYLDAGMEELFKEYGLSRASWDVLATLRRSGPPFRLSPTEIYRSVMRSSGAMTRRIDRLERSGLVTRVADPEDRRGILVGLTPAGRSLVDEIAEDHLQNERDLIGSLTPEEQQMLAALLKKLLLDFERERPNPPTPQREYRRGRGCSRDSVEDKGGGSEGP